MKKLLLLPLLVLTCQMALAGYGTNTPLHRHQNQLSLNKNVGGQQIQKGKKLKGQSDRLKNTLNRNRNSSRKNS